MGVNGLLQYFRSIERDTDISKWRGKRLAIDGHSWIHKAIYGSGYSIVVKKDYSRCLKSILARIDVFMHFGVHVVLVLDGADLPAKSKCEENRSEERKKSLAKAWEELEDGFLGLSRQL
jgi:exonuclease-1